MLTILLALLVPGLSAQPCLADWDYYRTIVLDHSSATDTLHNFQVRLDLSTGQLVQGGKLRSDGHDLRFVGSGCQPLAYYADSAAASTSNTVWVKVPLIPAGEQVAIRMYYGNNAAAQGASGDDTFIFFDDFEGDSVDLDKWEAIGAYDTWSQTGGEVQYASTYDQTTAARFKFVRTRRTFAGPVYLDFAAKQTNSAHFGFGSDRDTLHRYLIRYSSGASDTLSIPAVMSDTFSNGYATVTDWPRLVVPRSQYQDLTVLARIDANEHLVIDEMHNRSRGEAVTDSFAFNYFDMSAFTFVLSSFSNTNIVGMRYLKVRKTGQQPAVQTGDEVFQGTADAIGAVHGQPLTCYPNPTTGLLHIDAPHRADHYTLSDVQGRTVLETDVPVLHLDRLPAGLYLLRAWEDGAVVARARVMKE